MRRALARLLLLLAASCSRERTLPAGTLAAPEIRFEHVIYLLSPAPPVTIVDRFLPAGVQRVAAVPERIERMTVAAQLEKARGDYAPPTPEILREFGRGLTPAQSAALQESKQVLVLRFSHR